MVEIEQQLAAQKAIDQEREKKRKAFLKRQQKFYCQFVWADMAEENKQNLVQKKSSNK